jgi:hypothetical protein
MGTANLEKELGLGKMVEDGGGWWRMCRMLPAAPTSTYLHRPPPTFTVLPGELTGTP